MPLFSRTTLIDRIHTFLKGKIVKTPKNAKQITRNWQFTLINGKINVYGEKRQALGDMNKLAEISLISGVQILVSYTSNISPEDLKILVETLEIWGRNLVVTQQPLVSVDIEKLLN